MRIESVVMNQRLTAHHPVSQWRALAWKPVMAESDVMAIRQCAGFIGELV